MASPFNGFVARLYGAAGLLGVLFIALSVLVGAVGCGHDDPESGAIYVSSSPDSASIGLDGLNTGRITPDMLTDVPVGDHEVTVQRDGYIPIPDTLGLLLLPASVDSIHFDLTPAQGFGAVYVTSTPDSALIFLDGTGTTQLTPDTLVDVSTGYHWIAVEREGYLVSPESLQVLVVADDVVWASFELSQSTTRPVILESFTNVSCIPCADSNPMLYDLMDELGAESAVLLELHTWWPLPADPFYLPQRALMDSRVAMYGVVQAPWLVVEGVEGLYPQPKEAVVTAIQEAEPLEEVVLDLRAELTEAVLSCSLGVSAVGTGGQYLLIVFIAHDEIEYDEAPGDNDETLFRFVVRGALPGPEGVEVSVSGPDLQWFYWSEVLSWLEGGEGMTASEGITVVAVASMADSPVMVGAAVQKLP